MYIRLLVFSEHPQATATTRDEAHQELAGHRGHAGTDFLAEAAKGLQREEDQRGAVRHGRLRRVRAI